MSEAQVESQNGQLVTRDGWVEELQLLFIQRGLKLERGYCSCIFTCALCKCIFVVMKIPNVPTSAQEMETRHRQ